jgi:Flp pilus assembly protein TadD
VICLTLGILTWRQCRIYKDSDILWRTTLADDPNSFVALSSVGGIIFKEGRQEEAIADYRKALELEPNFFEARHDLASIYDQLGRDAEAIHEYQELLRLKLDFLPACNNLAWLLAVSPQASNRDGARAVTLALQAAKLPGGDNPSVLGTLAAAYAEAGQFDQAVAAAQKAQAWAAQKHMSGLASELSGQLRLYQARQAYRKPML